MPINYVESLRYSTPRSRNRSDCRLLRTGSGVGFSKSSSNPNYRIFGSGKSKWLWQAPSHHERSLTDRRVSDSLSASCKPLLPSLASSTGIPYMLDVTFIHSLYIVCPAPSGYLIHPAPLRASDVVALALRPKSPGALVGSEHYS
jgi:hypothetical protein